MGHNEILLMEDNGARNDARNGGIRLGHISLSVLV